MYVCVHIYIYIYIYIYVCVCVCVCVFVCVCIRNEPTSEPLCQTQASGKPNVSRTTITVTAYCVNICLN